MVLTKSSVRKALRKLEGHVGEECSGAQQMVYTLQAFLESGHLSFGHPGGAILPFFNALADRSYLFPSFVFVVHEQIGGHAAQGVAASTGKLGVAIGTSGPAATNFATPCGDAYADSNPVLFITGNVNRASSGSRAFQEVRDIKQMFRGAGAKKVYHVENTTDLPSNLAEAIVMAQTGRSGPVAFDVPKDVLSERTSFFLPPNFASSLDGLLEDDALDEGALSELIGKVNGAKRPLLLVGGGIQLAEAWPEVGEFVKLTGIPVAYTLKGKGAFPDSDPLCVGPVGMHGYVSANLAVEYADLLLAIGTRFDDRVVLKPEEWAPRAFVAQLDKDPQGIGPVGEKQRQPDLVIKGDARGLLRALNGLIERPLDSNLNEWRNDITKWERMFPLAYEQSDSHIKPQSVLHYLNEALKGRDIIVATEVGQHQMFAMQFLDVNAPRSLLTSGGYGTMGYGLPAALGAWLANKNKMVVLIAGDSSFRMMHHALQHYFEYQPNIKIMVLDNSVLDQMPGGMVSQWQALQTKQPGVSHSYKSVPHSYNFPSIVSLARGSGIKAFEIMSPSGIKPAVDDALGTPGPYVVSFKETGKQPVHVYPMIQPGKTVWETIFGLSWSDANERLKRLRNEFN